MKKAGILVLGAACAAVSFSPPAIAGASGKSAEDQAAEPLLPPVEKDQGGYRPPWANPDAKAPEPGIENDPVPFNPSDVDSKSNGLNNNL